MPGRTDSPIGKKKQVPPSVELYRDANLSWGFWLTIIPPHPYVFHKFIILKGVKVICFDTLLQVFILKVLRGEFGARIHVACGAKEGRNGDIVSRTLGDRLPHPLLFVK